MEYLTNESKMDSIKERSITFKDCLLILALFVVARSFSNQLLTDTNIFMLTGSLWKY